ncbi:LysM peptidoglycan-binding domain-containing protein [Candidatus Roizmanbacteria bacterium]|nr:MAG: LysM peptidoglycan-binding domain-containing protein [Candidatus Roizmanbacteria bacterium]
MNKKKTNARHLKHPFHVSFLTLFPILLLTTILLFGTALWKATTDLKIIGRGLRTDIQEPQIRDQLVMYRVQQDDTLESIAETFEITVDTIKWANTIPETGIAVNMILSIPPVSGVIHEVESGETTEEIAFKYNADPQTIKDFPYNVFADNEKTIPVPGQLLMVPGGRKAEEKEDVLGEFFKRLGF